MRPARIAAFMLLVLVCLPPLLAGAVWVVSRSDWAARQAAARATQALGQPVRLAGLALDVLPRPSLELEGLEIGPDTAAGPLLSVARATVSLRWREALRAPLVLERLRLDGPVLRPRVDAAGADNWSALVARLVELADTGPSAFDVGQLTVEGGRLDYADAARGWTAGVTGFALTAEGLRPATPFPLQLRFAGQAGDHVFHASLAADATLDLDRGAYTIGSGRLRGWIGGGTFGRGGAELGAEFRRVHLDSAAGSLAIEDLDFDALGVRGRGQAELRVAGGAPQARFAVVTRPFAPRAVGHALGRPLPDTADPAALGEALIEAAGRWDAAGLAVERVEGRLDRTKLAGALAWPAPPAVPRLALSLDEVDLDRYLPPDAGGPASPGEALAAVLSALGDLRLDAVIEVGRVSLAGGTARGLRVALTPPGDEVPAR